MRLPARPLLLAAALACAAPAAGQPSTPELFPYGSWPTMGLMDRAGNLVIEPRFEVVGDPSEGLVVVGRGDLQGYADLRGNVVMEPRWTAAGQFRSGYASVLRDTLSGLIDRTGRLVFPLEKRDYTFRFSEGMLPLRMGARIGYLDARLDTVIPARFDDADEFKEGRAGVAIIGRWGFIDTRGGWVVTPAYDRVSWYRDGMAAVYLDGKCGYVDHAGRMAVPIRYDECWEFGDGLAPVREGQGDYAWIDRTGRVVFTVPGARDPVHFSEGLASVELEGKFGYIDTRGQIAIPPAWDYWAGPFEGGLARVSQRHPELGSRPVGYIDRTGRYVARWFDD
ncbi:MAG TPA: WG repeat-containing protein [Longimicrobium sp.]|uniref:WG repeat-containing protein n=1 Tax=Longimicrobium sp. TaxID=2029185 RepID=UPI002ED89599